MVQPIKLSNERLHMIFYSFVKRSIPYYFRDTWRQRDKETI